MEIRGLAFLPFLFTIWTLLGLYAATAITVILGHSKYPYISTTGAQFPEWVVFMVVFIVASILGAAIASVQYRFMIIQSEPSEKRHLICQRILYAMGWMACIGTTMTGVCPIFDVIGMVGKWTGFFGLTIYPVMYYTDFQRLSLMLSRVGVSIVLREKTQDPENPQ